MKILKRSKRRVFALISSFPTSLHSRLNNTEWLLSSESPFPEGFSSLQTPQEQEEPGGALPAAHILGSDGGEHAEGGFHGVCGAAVTESPIALQPGVAEAAAHPPKLVLGIMSVIQAIRVDPISCPQRVRGHVELHGGQGASRHDLGQPGFAPREPLAPQEPPKGTGDLGGSFAQVRGASPALPPGAGFQGVW